MKHQLPFLFYILAAYVLPVLAFGQQPQQPAGLNLQPTPAATTSATIQPSIKESPEVAKFLTPASNSKIYPLKYLDDSKSKASLEVKWIDAQGTLLNGPSIQSMSWVWNASTSNPSGVEPTLRIKFGQLIPKGWTLRNLQMEGTKILEDTTKLNSLSTMTLDLSHEKAYVHFEFINPKGAPIEANLALQLIADKPYVLVHETCFKEDLRLAVRKAESKNFFIGLYCRDNGDSFDLFFYRSPDSTWLAKDDLISFDPENQFLVYQQQIPKPKDRVVYSKRLFSIGTLDEDKKESIYSIYYYPKAQPARFYSSLGLGITSYSYQEKAVTVKSADGTTSTASLKKSQVSMTGKVNLGYRLIPRKLDIAMNVFSNLVTITHNTTVNPNSATFYGINGRLGYRLPIGLGATEFMFLSGWYWWGMLVPENSYGIKSLSGPQLFFTMINTQAGHAGWWFYTKCAMITDKFSLTAFDNREFAVGGGKELSPRENKPFSITLDVAQAQFSNEENGMKLLSITLGVQKSL